MKNFIIGCIAFCVLFNVGNIATAEDIGRTSVDLREGNWSLLTSYEGAFTYDKYKKQPLYTKVFLQKDQDENVVALLVITSTTAGMAGKIQWLSDVCPDARPRFFTNDYGSNKQSDTRQCLIVNSTFAPFKFFGADSHVVKALDEKNISLFTSGYSLRTKYGTPNGTYVSVNFMSVKKFKGSPGVAPRAPDLYDVPQELVSWGETLHQAVKSAATSLRGRLVLPLVEYFD